MADPRDRQIKYMLILEQLVMPESKKKKKNVFKDSRDLSKENRNQLEEAHTGQIGTSKQKTK